VKRSCCGLIRRRSIEFDGKNERKMLWNTAQFGPPWTVFHNSQMLPTTTTTSTKLIIGDTSLDIPLFFSNVHRKVACEDRVSSLMMALVRRNM
jgi:hypothetical protein